MKYSNIGYSAYLHEGSGYRHLHVEVFTMHVNNQDLCRDYHSVLEVVAQRSLDEGGWYGMRVTLPLNNGFTCISLGLGIVKSIFGGNQVGFDLKDLLRGFKRLGIKRYFETKTGWGIIPWRFRRVEGVYVQAVKAGLKIAM